MTAFFIGRGQAQPFYSAGQEVFEVEMLQWGTNVLDCYPPVVSSLGAAIDTPGFPFSPQAITIGPRSTVDRCWVSWNQEQLLPGQGAPFVRMLSKDTPLMFSQPAGISGQGIRTTDNTAFTDLAEAAMGRGVLYVFPHLSPREITENNNPTNIGFGSGQGFQTTLLPTSYIKADGTVSANFYNPGVNVGVVQPTLHLQFWLKAGLALSAPTKRAPWFNSFKFSAGTVGVEDLLIGIPVYGRKSINLTMSSDSAGATFRIAALRNVQRYVLSQEVTIGLKGTITPLAASEPVNFSFCDIGADYLMLYATPGALLGTGPTAIVAAYD